MLIKAYQKKIGLETAKLDQIKDPVKSFFFEYDQEGLLQRFSSNKPCSR